MAGRYFRNPRRTSDLALSTAMGLVLLCSAGAVHAQAAPKNPSDAPGSVPAVPTSPVTPGEAKAADADAAINAPAKSRAAQSGQASGDIAEIVVTGSRIVRDGYTQPTPVTVAPVADLEKSTPTNLPDALNKLPQFANSTSPKGNSQLQANTGEHGNLLNLRGVGPNRVLILLDGTRVPPTTYKGVVDSNTIPQLLVTRVDIVTAGASAAYGSDAVSGVVNYVLDTKFEGIKGIAQYGLSGHQDLGNYRIGLADGFKFGGDRGHVILSVERFNSNGIRRSDRDNGNGRVAAVGSVVGSTSAPGTAANPLTFISGGSSSVETFGGLITSATVPGLANNVFNPNGTIRPFAPGAATGTAGIYVGGDGLYISGTNTLIAPLATNQGFGRVSYELTDNVTAYVQGNYARSATSYKSQANYILGGRVFSGNAFLDPTVQARLGPNDSFTISEYLEASGPLPAREVTTSYMTTAGLDGNFGGSWTWKAEYTHGSSTTDVTQQQFKTQNLYAALDAVRDANGNIVCRVSLTNPGLYPGCVPLNLFGQGAPSAAALAYTIGTSQYRAKNTTDDATLNVQGDLFTLPAGPLSIAGGIEYRRQTLALTSNSDPAVPIDTTGLRGVPATAQSFSATNVGVANGKLNVKEAFAEIAVPVLKDVTFARALDLNAAGRVTDYSTSGRVETWKVGGTWKPVDDLMFRITRSRDIRAPTLFDLFAGTQTTSATFTDPHTNLTNTIRQFTGGNPNLKPEVSKTLTFGVVLQPSFLPGFTASVDYYDLKIKGAIATQAVADILNECEASGGTSPSCSLISRPLPFSDHSAANFPTSINVVTQNISFIKTRGIDVDASYRTRLGAGDLTIRAYANWVDHFLTQTNSVAPVFDYAGYGANGTNNYARPKFKSDLSVNYAVGAVDFFVQESIIGTMKLGPTQVYAVPDIKPVAYTDATISYKLPGVGGDASLFFTVTNLLDKKPPLVPNVGVPGLYFPTLFALYDIAGRSYTSGVRFRF